MFGRRESDPLGVRRLASLSSRPKRGLISRSSHIREGRTAAGQRAPVRSQTAARLIHAELRRLGAGAARAEAALVPWRALSEWGVQLGHQTWVDSQAFQVERHAPTAPAHMHDPLSGPSPLMPLVLGWDQQPRLGRTQPGGAARALQLPHPQAPTERGAGRQARRYLGLGKGLTIPGGFFAGIAIGREKGHEKAPLGSVGCPSPPNRHSDPNASFSGQRQDRPDQQVSGPHSVPTYRVPARPHCSPTVGPKPHQWALRLPGHESACRMSRIPQFKYRFP